MVDGIGNRQTVLTFPNGEHEEITSGFYSGSISLDEVLCSSEITFGECNSSKFEATVAGINDVSKIEITVKQIIGEKTVDIFNGIVDSAVLQSNKTYRKIVAYDKLYYAGRKNIADWYYELLKNGPVTLKNFRDALFEELNIPQIDGELPNDNMLIERTISSSELSAIDVIKAICQINGCIGHINRAGVFTYYFLGDHNSSVYDLSDNYRRNDTTFEEIAVKSIDKLQINQEDGDIGVVVGEGENSCILQGNILVYGKSTSELTDIADKIYPYITGIVYTPADIKTIVSNPEMHLGDRINIVFDNRTISTLVLSNTLSGVQLLSQIISAKGEEKRSEVVDDIVSSVNMLKGKSNVLSRSIEETKLTISDVEQGLTNEIQQTASGLTAQIEQIQKDIGKEMPIYTVTTVPTMDNYPTDTFYKDIYYPYEPGDEKVLYPGNWTWEFDDDTYKLHLGSIAYNETTGACYKFVYEGGVFGWRQLKEDELSYILSSLAALKIETGQITLEVQETRKDIEDNYYTKTEADSKITQTATSIKQEVSATYTTKETTEEVKGELELKVGRDENDRIVSMLNASADEINLKSNRFSLDSTNTKITKDGTITANNGVIAGWNIGTSPLSSANKAIYKKTMNYTIGLQASSVDDNLAVFVKNYAGKDITYIRNNGEFYTESADIKGNISATSGTIGGWNIGNNALYADYGDYRAYIQKPTSSGSWVFSCQEKSDNGYIGRFIVDMAGNIYQDAGQIFSNGFRIEGCIIDATDGIMSDGFLTIEGNGIVKGDFRVDGTKKRVVKTRNYGEVGLNAYETPTPMFGDIGTGQLDSNGECIIYIDDVFIETIDNTAEYQVFLQKYGKGEIWVEKIYKTYFIIKGDVSGLRFAWEIKAKQRDYALDRLENEAFTGDREEIRKCDNTMLKNYKEIAFEDTSQYDSIAFEDTSQYDFIEFEDTTVYEI